MARRYRRVGQGSARPSHAVAVEPSHSRLRISSVILGHQHGLTHDGAGLQRLACLADVARAERNIFCRAGGIGMRPHAAHHQRRPLVQDLQPYPLRLRPRCRHQHIGGIAAVVGIVDLSDTGRPGTPQFMITVKSLSPPVGTASRSRAAIGSNTTCALDKVQVVP